MVEEVREAGAEVHQLAFDKAKAGNTRIFPPTVVVDPPLDSKLMQEAYMIGPFNTAKMRDHAPMQVPFVCGLDFNGCEQPPRISKGPTAA